MANQAEMSYSFVLQKLYNFSTNTCSVLYFLWKACFMCVPITVVVVLSSTNIALMQNTCSPKKCVQNKNLRASIPMESNFF